MRQQVWVALAQPHSFITKKRTSWVLLPPQRQALRGLGLTSYRAQKRNLKAAHAIQVWPVADSFLDHAQCSLAIAGACFQFG